MREGPSARLLLVWDPCIPRGLIGPRVDAPGRSLGLPCSGVNVVDEHDYPPTPQLGFLSNFGRTSSPKKKRGFPSG